MTLLDVTDLTVTIGGRSVVDGISFSVSAGETVGLIGESGSGKSMTCLSLFGLQPEAATVGGSIRFEDADLSSAGERRLRAVRGRRVGYVFQEPQTALDPLMRVGRQLTGALRAHGLATPGEAARRAVELAAEVRLPDPGRVVQRYPHELSGGQRQRVMIAMAMAAHPALVIADEPTTALDVTVQARILQLLEDLAATRGSGMLLVTHDIAVAVNTCDRLLVMRHGRIVEEGAARALVANPGHEYTAQLVEAAYNTSWRPAPAHETQVEVFA